MKYIFEEIIQTDNIFLIIEEHFDDDTEKEYMKNVIRDTIHHKLMDMVLDELDEEKRVLFLAEADDESKHPNLLERLKEWVDRFEDKIHSRAREAESEMINLIRVE
ncbi:hypothetical protein A2415_01520 [candidate division WWE3 bacterium RIFOXYC1_FULL_39_7]|uniref:Uncharacterized protein n=2 Tax=Katanobacteria TaxID=422282 RepID=A0A1F4X4Z4_UNCKA|nr:MAG: hypothetical protein A2415_01520 [candidate division WWE3 bacterium RIFOXYC1_FULL_39_7]OGC76780.1 MAG: hypothetical protein A2619_00445 [candidate division WWE3 bacterium RIFOXYD1_FULL_39_9]